MRICIESRVINRGHIKENHPREGLNNFPFFPILLLFTAVLLVAALFWERFYGDPNLDRAEVEEVQREAEKIAERHREWVQYVLIAKNTMKRPCRRCPDGVTEVTVRAGEIYKYGITTQGKARYTSEVYKNLGLVYIEEVRGDYIMCKEMETKKILAYRFLPEAHKPEVRLLRPPGNANKG